MATETPVLKENQERVLAILRKVSGNPELLFDSDGDVHVRFGNALIFVRVLGEPPLVRAYSPVLANLETHDRVFERLNELNSQLQLVRLVFVHGTIFAVADVAIEPFVPEHVLRACRALGDLSHELDEMLEAEFGGRTAFGSVRKRPMKN